MEDLPIPFVTVAADLKTGHEVWIRRGNNDESDDSIVRPARRFPAG
jgi:predicted acylesterase/phospholipase RssA